ncbi:MAG: glycoside hydrolase family 127 protein [Acidimicrobiales bacterium]
MRATLADRFWAPRREQLRTHTLPVMLERLEEQGVVDNFRRLTGTSDADRRAMHFSDSDLYKWLEAAVLADRLDLAEPVVDLVDAVQAHDGYVHTYYDAAPGLPGRYTDLDFGHEHYCAGHLIEAAIAHHEVTGSDRLLRVATRLADHLCATFGPGRDERTDAHPEVELALARLASATGEERYLAQARWVIERRLAAAGTTVGEWGFGGHAVRCLYLASGIAEVARATGDATYRDAAVRLFDSMVDEHAYPTGAVGGRWLGEAVGKPFEQPDAMAYAESCAAVAAVGLSERIWRLTGDPRALDQIEVLLCNAVPCGVGADGDTWFYSQPHAVAEVADESNPWVQPFDYGDSMVLSWFPARRHRWFLVPCCPPNLARMFAAVDRHVAEVDASGDLLVHLPVAARIEGGGWDVEVASGYPDAGPVEVRVHAAPTGRAVRLRIPGWAGGDGHEALPADGRVDLGVDWAWWETDDRVEGAGGTVFLRRGPVVHCVEGVDLPGVDLRDLVVDPTKPPSEAFAVRSRPREGALHRPVTSRSAGVPDSVAVRTVPYAEWSNRGTTTMRLRFPTR